MSTKEYFKNKREERRSKGLCTQCGTKAKEGKSLCEPHLLRAYEASKKWRIKHRRKFLNIQRKNYAKTREHQRNAAHIRQYGITLEQKRDLLKQQKYECPICLRTLTESSHTDHDHLTLEIRGILCGECNRLLGLAHDDVATLYRAINYLEVRR